MNIERVTPVGRPPGILHCPNCATPLGKSDDPAVGYLTKCSLCGVRLTVRIDGTRIFFATGRER